MLFVLIWFAQAYPSNSSDPKSNSSPSISESDEQNDDYADKMADIFNIPLDDNQRINLENCKEIICMPHYLCLNDVIVTNGTELFELRISVGIKVDRNDIVCDNMEMPCCADEAMKMMKQDQSADETRNNDDNANDDTSTEEDYNDENNTNNVIPTGIKCGYRNNGQKQTATRIIDGDDAQPNEFPWMVAIFRRLSNEDLRYIGGGSLIHGSVIVTAAHLVRRIDPANLVVRAGEHDLLAVNIDITRQERNVSNVIIHEDLYAEGLINDIALMVVNKNFDLTESVNTICLPPQSVQTDEGIVCTSSGWGKNGSNHNGIYQATLKKVELPIVERRKCRKLLRRTRLGPFFNLDQSLLCAGGGQRDTCKGDGGSPLFCQIPRDTNRYYQSGIVAGGIGCGGKRPGLYVNVGHFSNWITHQLGFININLEPENVLQYQLFD